jgi:hypothetical protein
MQTFLLSVIKKESNLTIKELLIKCFQETSKELDYKRLVNFQNKRKGKQRVEAFQLLNVILKRYKLDEKIISLDEAREILVKHDEENWPYKYPKSYEKFKQLVNKRGWRNHVAVKQWKDFSEELKLYYNCMIEEWVKRKYKNNMTKEPIDDEKLKIPPFLQNELFIKYHKENLIRKDVDFYKKFGDDLIAKDGYMWYDDGEYTIYSKDENGKNVIKKYVEKENNSSSDSE